VTTSSAAATASGPIRVGLARSRPLRAGTARHRRAHGARPHASDHHSSGRSTDCRISRGACRRIVWSLARSIPRATRRRGGVGDVLVGLLALPVAALLQANTGSARAAAIAWNVLGILDLADAVVLGFLTSLGLLATTINGPNPLSQYPLVMIPAFAVPASLLLHAISLRQFRRTTVQ
jgi:hypothetical protein